MEAESNNAVTDNIGNYYEILVRDEMAARKLDEFYDTPTLQDIACTALNQLPAKYIRSSVDLYFYTAQMDRSAMDTSVREAIDYALTQVKKRQKA